MSKCFEINRGLYRPLLFRMLAGVINRMRAYRYQAVFILACALSACGSAPHQPNRPPLFSDQAYWTNPFWQVELFSAVQSVVHLPANAASLATPRIHGTVKFLYDNGAVKDPVIVASTGNPQLDKLLLQQVVTAKVPKPYGLHTDQPHEFELPLEMFTPYESFEYNVYAAIDRNKLYPRDPILKGEIGSTTVDFDYLDGKALNIVIAKSSENKELDQASIDAVSKAELPAPPPGYDGKTLPMQVIVCYCLNSSKSCSAGKNVIVVEGTRILRHAVVRY